MNTEAKAMNYSIGPITRMVRSKMTIVGGNKKKAEALEGTWIKLNETEYALVEAEQVTRILIDEDTVGCSCGGCDIGTVCEHVLAFEDLESIPQQLIGAPQHRWLSTYLFEKGWYAKDRYVYASLDEKQDEPEVGAEIPPVNKTKLDPVNEEKELDTGVSEDKPEPKTRSRKCVYCGDIISGTDLDQVKRDIAEHTKNCPKNPANKKKPPTKKPVTPKKTTDTKTAPVDTPPKREKVKPQSKKFTCEICGTEYDTADEVLNCIEKCKETQELEETKALVKQDTTSEGEAWTDAQLEVMRKTVAANATPAEFAYFLNVAKYNGLNPFLREIYFVKNEKGQTTIITGRDGYLTIAKKDQKFEGIQSMEVCETDVFETSVIMNDEGQIVQNMTHQISNFKDRGEIIGAWARGQMKGQEPVIIFAAMREYDKSKNAFGGKIWKQYPSSMIRKVAEAMVLKRIAGISGLVTEAEVGGTDLIQIEGGE